MYDRGMQLVNSLEMTRFLDDTGGKLNNRFGSDYCLLELRNVLPTLT